MREPLSQDFPRAISPCTSRTLAVTSRLLEETGIGPVYDAGFQTFFINVLALHFVYKDVDFTFLSAGYSPKLAILYTVTVSTD
ncbi:hypothetical protein GCM10009655_11850 [Rhodoglobus aureus]|uniref:Uncharacterized protein n=1 Tax=Rhodoglobus aureus TaxID=191497 RepID=A0ABN1VLD4_9MICO